MERVIGFQEIDWNEPLDVDLWIRAVPSTALVKGMFLISLVEVARDNGVADLTEERFHRFRDYPMSDWFHLAVECCHRAFSGLPTREALRRIGHAVYPMFFDTMVGKAIFAVAGANPQRVIKLASRAYEVSIHPGTVSLAALDDHHAELQLREVYSFSDSYQVGVWEGGLRTVGVEPHVSIKRHSLCDVDFRITW